MRRSGSYSSTRGSGKWSLEKLSSPVCDGIIRTIYSQRYKHTLASRPIRELSLPSGERNLLQDCRQQGERVSIIGNGSFTYTFLTVSFFVVLGAALDSPTETLYTSTRGSMAARNETLLLGNDDADTSSLGVGGFDTTPSLLPRDIDDTVPPLGSFSRHTQHHLDSETGFATTEPRDPLQATKNSKFACLSHIVFALRTKLGSGYFKSPSYLHRAVRARVRAYTHRPLCGDTCIHSNTNTNEQTTQRPCADRAQCWMQPKKQECRQLKVIPHHQAYLSMTPNIGSTSSQILPQSAVSVPVFVCQCVHIYMQ